MAPAEDLSRRKEGEEENGREGKKVNNVNKKLNSCCVKKSVV